MIRRILLLVTALVAITATATAQTPTAKSRADLYTEIQSLFGDSGASPITPEDFRTSLQNIVASAGNATTDGDYLLESEIDTLAEFNAYLTDYNVYSTTAIDALIAALQADVDQNESDADAAIAAVQADVDTNESDADTAIAAVQTDVDNNQTVTDAHAADTNNPHTVTATQLGLGNVDDTADADKPISTATQTALDAKQPLDADLTDLAEDGSLSGSKVGFGISAANISNSTLAPDRLASGTGLQVVRRNAANTALEFATVAVGGGDISAADIDTLAEINGILTDATLVDGGADQSAHAARAARLGVVSDGTSLPLNTPDNSNLDFGTDDLTFGAWTSVGAFKTLWAKGTTTTGVYVQIGSTNASLHIGTSVTTFNLGAHGMQSGVIAFVSVRIDRDGMAYWGINGVENTGVDISSVAAESATDTNKPLTFAKAPTSNTYYGGFIGETFIVDGLLTADQIAQIHRNGTAKDMGLTMYQHLVPSKTLGAGIFEDISGNSIHAALGTSGITIPQEFELEADPNPRPALRSDGSDGTRIYTTLNSQNPGTGDFLTEWAGVFPQDATGTSRRLISLSSSVSDVRQPYSFGMGYDTTNGLFIQIVGATTSDFNRLSSVSLFSQLVALGARGIEVAIAAQRSANGASVFLRIDGKTLDITSVFSAVTGGTPPTWQGSVTGTYLSSLYLISTSSSAQDLHDLRFYNASADTLAEAADAMSGNPVGAKWQAAGDSGYSTGTWQNDGNIETFTGATAAGFTADNTSGPGTARSEISLPRNVVGSQYRATFTATLTSGAAPTMRLGNGSSSASNTHTVTAGANDVIFTATAGTVNRVACGVFTSTAGAWAISDFTLEILGKTVGLDLSEHRLGGMARNPRFANGSSHWEISDGVTHTLPTTRGRAQGTLTWTAEHGFKALTSAVTVPDGAIIERITVVPDFSTSGSGATFGTVNDSDQFVATTTLASGTTYTTGDNLTFVTRFTGGTADNDGTLGMDPDTANVTGSATLTIDYIVP